LLKGLDTLDWPEPLKEMQRNWIGKSMGCELEFPIVGTAEQEAGGQSQAGAKIKIFTTRIDTVFGTTFLVIAPEHELVDKITTADQREKVTDYVAVARNRSERERMSEVKRVSGAFTGAYAINPFTNEPIPVWIADYVLAGYGTGAVMAVPGHDERDHRFAKHFNLPIVQVVEGPDVTDEAFVSWEAKIMNSGFMNGMTVMQAIEAGIRKVEEWGIGKGKVNYRMRDAIFGRQRYWGEPFPVYFVNGTPKLVDQKDLPVTLPEIDQYKPTETGDPPLARAKEWNYKGHPYELTTMPGWAGSSWYWFRYMDPKNDKEFCSREAQSYWQSVDLYIGGSEHATGHLLYSRFWCKALKDLGYVDSEEPFKKLVNQGHIQGVSRFVYRINGTNKFVSAGLRKDHEVTALHVDVSLVHDDVLDVDAFRKWRDDFAGAEFILENGKYLCGSEVEKMSKSKHNVVNPDDIIASYGADTLRMYEMFLGPLELSKPWNTNGIDGVYKFLRRFWNLFHDGSGKFAVSDAQPSREELKTLHKTLKKVEDDIERLSFNTSVSEFMICVNELNALKCDKRAILEPLVIALSPFAPHVAEELWEKLGYKTTILEATFPSHDAQYLIENSFEYPISINGKVRAKMNFVLDMPKEDIEKVVMASEAVLKWTEGKPPKKVIIVPGRIVNIVT
ncbi:MAG TPA: leucine--tRNA ligase, partial [Ohtaekwangia sp.]|nr:leucine--tRNA ligase [Ohtaekwangia sp.]